MSTANFVPETHALTGTDARSTLTSVSTKRLISDSFVRLRAADGFSHARSMAFETALIFVQGVIALVGFASVIGAGGLSSTIVKTLQDVVPGATGLLLTDAVQQAHRAGSTGRWLPLALGTVAALITGTTLMGQIERAMNRLYGIERDRPTLAKYGRAFLLTVTAGVLAVVAFAMTMLGRGATNAAPHGGFAIAWAVARWPLGAVLLIASTTLIFRWAPNRRQPGWSWLTSGAVLGVVLLIASTLLLDGVFRLSSTFGQTYGPLAGLVALLFWGFIASFSVLFGASFTAQLEAIRAGSPAPRSTERAAFAAETVAPVGSA